MRAWLRKWFQGYWARWNAPEARQTLHCECDDDCDEYPMMCVNGQFFMCWTHYCKLNEV